MFEVLQEEKECIWRNESEDRYIKYGMIGCMAIGTNDDNDQKSEVSPDGRENFHRGGSRYGENYAAIEKIPGRRNVAEMVAVEVWVVFRHAQLKFRRPKPRSADEDSIANGQPVNNQAAIRWSTRKACSMFCKISPSYTIVE